VIDSVTPLSGNSPSLVLPVQAPEPVSTLWRRESPTTAGNRTLISKRCLIFNRLQDVISQKAELFITIAVRTSNPIRSDFFENLSSNCMRKFFLQQFKVTMQIRTFGNLPSPPQMQILQRSLSQFNPLKQPHKLFFFSQR
jgi:hypothetical protein